MNKVRRFRTYQIAVLGQEMRRDSTKESQVQCLFLQEFVSLF